MRIGAGGEFGFEGLVRLAVIEPGDTIRARLDLHQHLRQVAIRGRTGYQGNVWRPLKDFLALLLGDTAEHGKALPFLAQLLEVVEAVEDLLLGLVANRAGVVEDEVSLFLALHLRVPLRDERAHDLFGVVEVHLAAKGLDVKRLLSGAHNHPR